MMDLFGKGAEANLYRDGDKLVKDRISKKYRVSELDSRLRRQRTKREGNLLQVAREAGVMTPKVFEVEKKGYKLVMEYIDGQLAKEYIDESSDTEIRKIAKKIGASMKLLHNVEIIHNDLTTSNLILKADKVYFIDFGLAYRSRRLEDKAMDLVVFKKSILATHTDKVDLIWDSVIQGYDADKELITRIGQIEKRVRYS